MNMGNFWFTKITLTVSMYSQVFINYKLSCTTFRTCKTILEARLCLWEIVHVKEQTCMGNCACKRADMHVIYSDRNCTTLYY